MISTFNGREVLPPTQRLRRTCRRVSASVCRHSNAIFRTSTGCKTHLTAHKTYVAFVPTTPSTPINDAHQEGYSFIEVANRFIRIIRTQRGATSE